MPSCPGRWQAELAVLQHCIPQAGLPASSARETKPCRNGARIVRVRIAAIAERTPRRGRWNRTDFGGLSRISINAFPFPRLELPRVRLQLDRRGYASRGVGGGRCCSEWSVRCRAVAVSPLHTRASIPDGGATTREDGCTNPLAGMPPRVRLQQSLAQDLLETAGPVGAFALLRQQHFAWLRPQHVDPLNDRADNSTRDADDKTSARHAAISARAKQ